MPIQASDMLNFLSTLTGDWSEASPRLQGLHPQPLLRFGFSFAFPFFSL